MSGSKSNILIQPVTVTTAVHIPMLGGYWAQSLDVLHLFFESLFSSTDLPFDLMVFDNGSCGSVQDYLIELYRGGKIQYLTLSAQNVKKLGAMDYLFSVAPGEYIAYADSDVYFLPGWLESSLEILDAFPEAGQVTALPTIDKRNHYIEGTISGIQGAGDLKIERGKLIEKASIDAHRISIGREETDYLETSGKRDDVCIRRGEVRAYISAQDFQFTTRRAVIEKVLPLQVRHTGEYYDAIYSPVFESKINELGFWRLSTTQYLIHHMGNCVPDIEKELAGILDKPWLTEISRERIKERSARRYSRLLESRPIRDLLKRIYTLTYKLLFER
ncbi:MAG: glycosyltransferase family 2 protein [Anaerolineales bacterium]|nr:glycosyltransferase family 2 protein [Anaerolineales bacterium]